MIDNIYDWESIKGYEMIGVISHTKLYKRDEGYRLFQKESDDTKYIIADILERKSIYAFTIKQFPYYVDFVNKVMKDDFHTWVIFQNVCLYQFIEKYKHLLVDIYDFDDKSFIHQQQEQ